MIAVISRAPASSVATRAARKKALDLVHSVATAHGLGKCEERLLSQLPLSSHDARGPALRAHTKDLGNWLNQHRPHICIVSGSDLTRHVLAAMRRYRTGSLSALSGYSATDRFVTVDHRWAGNQLVNEQPDSPSACTTFIPVLDLGVFLSETYKGRALPDGYWTQWTASLIQLASGFFRGRSAIALDAKVPLKVRRELERTRVETPFDAMIRDNLGF